MTPLEQLLDHAKKAKRDGKTVISIDYVLAKFEQERGMYSLDRAESILRRDDAS